MLDFTVFKVRTKQHLSALTCPGALQQEARGIEPRTLQCLTQGAAVSRDVGEAVSEGGASRDGEAPPLHRSALINKQQLPVLLSGTLISLQMFLSPNSPTQTR